MLSLPPEGQNEVYKKIYVDEYAFWNKVNVEWHSFVSSDVYYEYLNDLKLDMVIIPRSDSYFNRCKSNLKFLECSMLEVPVIGQSFPTGDSPYKQTQKMLNMYYSQLTQKAGLYKLRNSSLTRS